MERLFNSLKLALSVEKKVQLAVFSTFFFVWILLLQGLFKFRNVDWFYQIVFCRSLLIFLSVAFSAALFFFDLPNIISIYCLICMACQSFLSIFEGPKTIEFYQYISYFVLVSTLSLNGRLRDWLKYAGPIIGVSMIVPLFFKDHSYFLSLGTFTYSFTTPIAVLFLSFIVARLSSGKFEALILSLSLQRKLLEIESNSKMEIFTQLEAAKTKIAKDANQLAFSQVTQQVVHDIRSPVAALNAIVHSMGEIDSDTQAHIRAVSERIQSIANNLLRRSILGVGGLENTNENLLSFEVIPKLLELVVKEKRLQIRSSKDLTFEVSIDASYKSSVALVNKVEFCNIISNLINNSIEAIASKGIISVRSWVEGAVLYVELADNGKGIPSQVMGKLGCRGFSYDKFNGNGLGLFHAVSNLRSWGGDLEISSNLGYGTTIKCSLICKTSSPTPPEIDSPLLHLPTFR